ncbi:MAG: hypothetical protein ACLFSE_05895 [Spirochaetia bacterium]
MQKDAGILRDTIKRYAEAALDDIQEYRREKWTVLNSMEENSTPVYLRAVAWKEFESHRLECTDPFYRSHESTLKQKLFIHNLRDDSILEPWLVQQAEKCVIPERRWGPEIKKIPSGRPGGAWKYDPPIKQESDLDKLILPAHTIDEKISRKNVEMLEEAADGILPVFLDRKPFYWVFSMDLSTDMAYLRGLEQMMWDMVENPELLHRLAGFLRDGILKVHREAEEQGDITPAASYNQAMAYSRNLVPPDCSGKPVNRKKIWGFFSAQEFTGVSPAMHEEFLLQYQMPIMEKFGLVSYGCCEELHRKTGMLEKIPNLRRIALAPRTDTKVMAEKIGNRYVLSYRPNPADIGGLSFDKDSLRKKLRQDFEILRENGCLFDVTLKDVETVRGQEKRLETWIRIVREELEGTGK